MPQMAPLNWLTLMLFFIMTLTLFNILNFYSFNKKIQKKYSSKNLKTNWKW